MLLRPVEFESTKIVWKTIVLPLNYGRYLFNNNYTIKKKEIINIRYSMLKLITTKSEEYKNG